MRSWGLTLLLFGCASLVQAQVAEFSVSGGVSRFGTANLGTITDQAGNLDKVSIDNGFRLALRFTLNTWRFMGHEFGYAYSHSNLRVASTPATVNSMPIHQGFYDFMLYALPEGSPFRPFATGGVQFSSFVPPGASIYYGNQVTKFGVNYGGGVKVKVTPVIGLRFDVRDYNTGQPFNLPGATGRLNQWEVSVGAAFLL